MIHILRAGLYLSPLFFFFCFFFTEAFGSTSVCSSLVTLRFYLENLNVLCQQGKLILAHLCDEHKGLKTGMCMVYALIGVNNMTLFHTGILSSDQVGCAICCFSLLFYMSRMQQYFTASFLSIVEILEPATQIVICYLRLSMLPSLSTNCTIKAF